jgi:hypothetical protein
MDIAADIHPAKDAGKINSFGFDNSNFLAYLYFAQDNTPSGLAFFPKAKPTPS